MFVDAAGRITAVAIGSAQIFAEAGGVRSAPTLAIVAQPQAGALLVTDAQVVSVGPPLGLAAGESPGVGTQYEVTLQGVAAPAPGTMVIAAETAPVAGKVVATRPEGGGVVVTLALAPLYQLFSAYDIKMSIPLSAFGFEAVPDRALASSLGSAWQAQRRARALHTQRPLGVFDPFKAWDCDASIKAKLLAAPIQLSLVNDLTVILEDRPGYSKHALEGSAKIVGSAGIKVDAGFTASGTCMAQGQIKLPVFGWFSMLVMPAVRFGLGAELEAQILLVTAELSVSGSIGFDPKLGWECGGAAPACRGLKSIVPRDDFKTTSKIPTEHDKQAKISGHFFIVAGLDASLLLGLGNAQIVEARIGPKQSFDLAFADDQASRPDYASSYDLKLEGTVEPGSALKKAIEKVIGDDSTTVNLKLEISRPISESPKGTLGLSVAQVRPGSPVDFTVDFDQATVSYWLLDYNVKSVELYRRRAGETKFTPWKFMDVIATNKATYRWTPEVADAGSYEFAALVETKIEVLLLEVAKDTVRQLEVSCFAAPRSTRPGDRAKVLSASAQGARLRPQATTCADTWAGTSTYIARTPGLPTANITAHANVTWTFDPSQGSAQSLTYKPSGSFDLAFNNPDACTTALSPSTFAIDPSLAKLVIFDNGFTPPTYGINGSQLIDVTTTVSCPGRSDVVSVLRGLLVVFASGSGPYAPDQTTLSGNIDDAATYSLWNFSRP